MVKKRWSSLAFLLFLASAGPAAAQQDLGSGFTISGGVTATSDYRFRGSSQTNGDPALQGSATIDHASGFYIGGFASTLSDDPSPGAVELSGYVGYTREISSGTAVDVGVQLYGFPDDAGPTGASYLEPYASVRHTLGPVTAQVGAAYAPEQEALGNDDSLYLFGDVSSGLIVLPATVTARLGYTSGPARLGGFADYLDWRVGVEHRRGPATFAIEYVDTDLPDEAPNADATLVASVRLGF